jgi:hypothetical protein
MDSSSMIQLVSGARFTNVLGIPIRRRRTTVD